MRQAFSYFVAVALVAAVVGISGVLYVLMYGMRWLPWWAGQPLGAGAVRPRLPGLGERDIS